MQCACCCNANDVYTHDLVDASSMPCQEPYSSTLTNLHAYIRAANLSCHEYCIASEGVVFQHSENVNCALTSDAPNLVLLNTLRTACLPTHAHAL